MMEPSQLIEATTRAVWDLLAFRVFVSPSLLILIYYLGAIGIPLLAWKLARPVKSRIADIPVAGVELPDKHRTGKEWLPSRAKTLAYAFAAFLVMELGWRVLFEFMLAYFQMRDYLAAIHAG